MTNWIIRTGIGLVVIVIGYFVNAKYQSTKLLKLEYEEKLHKEQLEKVKNNAELAKQIAVREVELTIYEDNVTKEFNRKVNNAKDNNGSSYVILGDRLLNDANKTEQEYIPRLYYIPR